MKRIPFDRFSDKRFYYANAPPCKQGFSLTTDFTWRILLCTMKYLARLHMLQRLCSHNPVLLPHHPDGYIPQSDEALNSCQKTADKIENKIKTNKNRELRENKQRIINKIRRNSEKPIDRFSEKVYCEYNNSKGERNMSTIQDVAQKAGVSVSTVYKVFSDSYKTRALPIFSLVNMLIKEEYLYYFPNGRQAKIFDRKEQEFTLGSKFRGKFGACKDVLKPNRLLLSCAANFTSIKEVEDAFCFFSNELVVYAPENQGNWMNYSLYQINANEKMKEAVISFMRGLGMGVKDIKVNIDQKEMEAFELPPFLSDEFKNILLQTKVNDITAKVVYEKFETDLMQDESTGVQKLFGLLCPLIDIMVNGKVLICDELESSLHESLVYELVRMFMNYKTDKFAQIIFTTHETGLLNLDLFRRDQIWFTEMDGIERGTDLYSLAEIKNVRKEDNFGKGYIAGKYGAIPMLNVNFASIVSKM